MTGYPETTFCTNSCPYKGTFPRSIQKSAISKKRSTGRISLMEFLASYEQKKKFEAMQLMRKQFPPSINRY